MYIVEYTGGDFHVATRPVHITVHTLFQHNAHKQTHSHKLHSSVVWLCASARAPELQEREWEARWNNDNKTQRRRIIMHAIVMITSAANTNQPSGGVCSLFLREINVDDFLMNRHGGGKRWK